MKATALVVTLTLFFVCIHIAHGKNKTAKDKVFYVAPSGLTFYTYDFTGQKVVSAKQTAFEMSFVLPNTFPLKAADGKTYIEVQFLGCKDRGVQIACLNGVGMEPLAESAHYINSTNYEARFVIESTLLDKMLTDEDIESRANTLRYNVKGVTGATISTPYKFRPKIGDRNYTFAPEINLGPYAGVNTRLDSKNPIFLNLVVSAGISSISINDNVQVQKDQKDALAMGFYGSIGLVLQIDKFQVGGMWGGDFVSGEQGKNWIYNEHSWFSFGVGYNFIGGTSKAVKETKQNTEDTKVEVSKISAEALKGARL